MQTDAGHGGTGGNAGSNGVNARAPGGAGGGAGAGSGSGSVTGSYQYRMASSATITDSGNSGVQRGTGTMYQGGEQASGALATGTFTRSR